MKKICLQTWAPLRKEASSASEMVSALLFGETCIVVKTHNDWLNVVCDYDNYVGWIPESYVSEFEELHKSWTQVLGAQSAVLIKDTYRVHLSAGSNIPVGNILNLDGMDWNIVIRDPNIPVEAWQLAMGFLRVPYLWGGRSDCGMDCSGLTQVVAKIKGVSIPRDSADQSKSGTAIGFGDRLPNDFAFFKNDNGKITHVGILSPHGIIHAYGNIREDDFTSKGIVNRNTQNLTHTLYCIQRIL